MSTQVKRRRGTAAENAAFTGAEAEIVVLTDSKRLAVHDGSTGGGMLFPNAADLLSGAITRGTASGTDTYTLTLPYFPSYTSGYEVDITFTNANTTTSTLNINSLGAKGLKDENGSNFTAGQIAAAGRYIFRYNGTEFRRVTSATAVKRIVEQSFTSSGTYTPTTGMLYCHVKVKGGGGGGGGGTTVNGGGGGAGAYAEAVFSASTIGASKTVTIGAKGTGAVSNSNGGNAGTSSLGSLISCPGGDGGQGGVGTALTGGAGGTTPTGGTSNIRGEPGQYGISSFGGNGASGPFGSGGSAGGAAAGYGAGGSGGTGSGADGSNGYITIIEFCSQ